MIKIDVDICLLCAGCIPICPDRALYMDLESLKIDYTLCTLCRFCVRFCPMTALAIKGEIGLSGGEVV
jgi:pyruvate formate lyase activating enzyme